MYLLSTFVIYMYVCSFCILELLETIFKIPQVSCFLSNRICQDMLEKYFSMQRQAGTINDNPTVLKFTKNSDTLRLIGNMWFEDAYTGKLLHK